MKALTALALIVLGWASLSPAQQIPSTADNHIVLYEKATALGNSKLQKLVQHFKPIALWESEFHPRGHTADQYIYVPGEIKGIDWSADRAQTITVVMSNSPAILTVHDLEELKKRKRELIDAGVTDSPSNPTEITEAPRHEAALPPSPTPTTSTSEPTNDPTPTNVAPPAITPEPPQVATPTPEQPPTKSSQGSVPESSEPMKQSKSADDNSVLVFLFIVAVIVVVVIVKAVQSSRQLSPEPRKLGRDREGYEEAEVGIPHAGYRLTKSGFEVAIKNQKGRNDGCLSLFKSYPVNRIQVTPDAIIINGKRLRPNHFEGFQTGFFKSRAVVKEHLIGYNYGNKLEWLPGVWDEMKADELVLALNLHLRAFWKVIEDHVGEDPRNKRRNDF